MIEVPKQQPSPAARAGRVLAVFAIAFVAFVTVNSLRGGTTSVSVPSISALTAEASAALKFESPSVTITSSSHPALGTVQAICDKSGPAPKLYVNISYAKWTALDGPENPNRAGFWLSFDLPEGCEPFKSVFMSYEVGGSGHPPFDGRQFNGEAPGGFGVPHSDVHFWTISDAERMALVGYGSCVTIPHAANTPTGKPEVCNQQAAATDAATAKYYSFPPREYTSGFEEITIFGGAAVVGHGNHMATVEDNAGPGACTLAPGSPAPQGPPWLGCMQQFLGVVTGAGWVERNCSCGPWTAMSSPVMITYDGKVYGNEVMPMVALADQIAAGNKPNPYLQLWPQAEKYSTSGYQTTHTFSAVSGGAYQTGLVLSPTWRDADPE